MVDKRGYFELQWVSKYRTAWVITGLHLYLIANGVSIQNEGGQGAQFWQKIELGNEKVGVGWRAIPPSPFVSVIYTE